MQIFFNNFNTNRTNTNFKAKKQILVKGTKLTEAQIKRNSRNEIILKMLSKGFSKAEIAEKLKITVKTISNFLESKTIPAILESHTQRIIERIKNGETVESIINEEGINKRDLEKIAKSANLETITNFQKNKQERDNLILKKLSEGYTTEEIAKSLQVSNSLVAKILKGTKLISQNKKERNLRIIEKISNRITYEQIAQEENLHIETVKRIKQKAVKSGLMEDIKSSRNSQIIEAYKTGENINQIAQNENLSEASIIRILSKAGIQYTSDFQKKKMSKEKQILELLMQGFSRKDIAEILKVEIYKINQIAEENNVFQTLILERTSRIVEKLKKGYPTKKIAEEEGVNVATVIRTAHKENITLPIQKAAAKKRIAIAEDLRKGLNISDIAEKHHVSKGLVGVIKREIGLTKKYNYTEKASEFKFNEVKEQSRNITKLRDTYRKFKLGERNPEIIEQMLQTLEILNEKLKEFKLRSEKATKPSN